MKDLLFAKVSQEHLKCFNLNHYILLSTQEKSREVVNLLNLSSLFNKIRIKDNRNQEKNSSYKRILAMKAKKKDESLLRKEKKLIKYDERMFSPEVLFKLEEEESQLNEVKESVFARISRDKQGEVLSRDELFFKIYKYIGRLNHKKENEHLLSPLIKKFLLEKCFNYVKKANKNYESDVSKGFQYFVVAYKILQELGLEWMFFEFVKHNKKG